MISVINKNHKHVKHYIIFDFVWLNLLTQWSRHGICDQKITSLTSGSKS